MDALDVLPAHRAVIDLPQPLAYFPLFERTVAIKQFDRHRPLVTKRRAPLRDILSLHL